MKFLLTSAGINNASIYNALVDLLGKPIADIGIHKAVLYRKHSQSHEEDKWGSVMEKFFRALFGTNKS